MTLPAGFVSCSEEIDESNFAIKTDKTAADFIDADPQFSMIKTIFSNVRLGASENASPIYSVLTARGNYTVFLPTNDAVQKFMGQEGVASLEALIADPELSNLVAKSCIIDHNEESAYETVLFPLTGAFPKPNLNDRLLSCQQDSTSHYIINGTSHVIDEDNEVSNGFVHVVDAVVAPSSLTLDKMIGIADNMQVFSYLLKKTTWADSLYENLDISYENPDRPKEYIQNGVKEKFVYAEHRYIGYTALVEPDSVYTAAFGVQKQLKGDSLTNGEDFLKAIEKEAEKHYGNKAVGDYSNPDNAVNRYVAYHLINGKMAFNNLVRHFNEYNYKIGDPKNPQRVNTPTNVWDFYTTMGKYPSLIKITEVGTSSVVEADRMNHPLYANRISVYDNTPDGDYTELDVLPNFEGVLLSPDNGGNDNNALNGYYYPINKILVCSEALCNELANRRIRIDASTMFPELLSNSVRGGEYTRFDDNQKYDYFTNIMNVSPQSVLLYLQLKSNASWNDFQGDQIMVTGLYDVTIKLPPVPAEGNYEIRMGVGHNSLRGMTQIYFGDDPDKLMPAGLPYDMRQSPGPDNPAIPWIEDGDDPIINLENDKNLRNQGYLKGPRYFCVCDGKGENPVRDVSGAYGVVRRIITQDYLYPHKAYYLRFKTALKNSDSQLIFDYFEFASKNVYNGPVPEDVW